MISSAQLKECSCRSFFSKASIHLPAVYGLYALQHPRTANIFQARAFEIALEACDGLTNCVVKLTQHGTAVH